MKFNNHSASFLLLFIVFSVFFVSCAGGKKAIYFNNIQDSVVQTSSVNLEAVIQKNDLLSVSVSSLNPEASKIFNTPNNIGNQEFGYLVNSDGFIQFPVLGNIKAAGLTKKDLKETITQKLINQKLLLDPIVSVRYLNYRITVIGEVAKPTVINVPSEKISLLEALGFAGDLTLFAKRDNVMIIREEEDKKVIKRINLNSEELLNSPYYYLKSNDVVYVEPNKARVSSANEVRQWLPLGLSILSFATVILYRFR